jgi:hypothetical protein
LRCAASHSVETRRSADMVVSRRGLPGSSVIRLIPCGRVRHATRFPLTRDWCVVSSRFKLCDVNLLFMRLYWPKAKLYCTRPLGTLTRSLSAGVKPLPRLHFALVCDVSSLAARSILPADGSRQRSRKAAPTSARTSIRHRQNQQLTQIIMHVQLPHVGPTTGTAHLP